MIIGDTGIEKWWNKSFEDVHMLKRNPLLIEFLQKLKNYIKSQ